MVRIRFSPGVRGGAGDAIFKETSPDTSIADCSNLRLKPQPAVIHQAFSGPVGSDIENTDTRTPFLDRDL